jgi:hypothetical protein
VTTVGRDVPLAPRGSASDQEGERIAGVHEEDVGGDADASSLQLTDRDMAVVVAGVAEQPPNG